MREYGEWSLPVRYVVFGILFLFLLLGLWFIRDILEPLIIAAFVAYLINPAVNFLTTRTRLSRPGAVNLVYIITLLIFIGTPATLTPIFFDEFKQVLTDVLDLFNQLTTWLARPRFIPGLPYNWGQLGSQLAQFRDTFLSSFPDQAIQLLEKTSLGALWLIVILVAVYYFLAKWPILRSDFINVFPDRYTAELNELYDRVRRIWMSYLRGQLLLMLIVGVVFTIAWAAIGVPGALVLGAIAGFLTLIPDVGPFIAVTLAFGVALLEGSNLWVTLPHWLVALLVVGVYFFLIGIKNFWLRPLIMGRSVHMNEAMVLISILLATVLWGILGALLVVPVLATLAVIVDYLRRRILGLPPFPSSELFISEGAPPSGAEKIAALKSRISKRKKG